MRQDGGSPWTAFEARQTISTQRCEFTWIAATGPAGLVQVRDSLSAVGGKLGVRLLGLIPLAGARPSPDLTRGELIRYLAELPWAPGAILGNRDLVWTVEPDGRLTVATGVDKAAKVTFTLDASGRIAEAYCPDRPRATKHGFEASPWRGRFSEYARRGGVWVPSVGAVSWILDGAAVDVWTGHVTAWRPRP